MTFSPAPPPPTLAGEEYFCAFNGIMSPLELSMGSNTGSCSVQVIVSQVNDIQLGNIILPFYLYLISSFISFISFLFRY